MKQFAKHLATTLVAGSLFLFSGCASSKGGDPATSGSIMTSNISTTWEGAHPVRVTENHAWYAGESLGIEGKGWQDTAEFWNRLPARAEEMVPPLVWNLSKNTAGMAVRFASDSPEVRVLWSGGGAMNHMAASGVSGVDLYRRTPSGDWTFAAVGRPNLEETEAGLLPRPNVPWNPSEGELTEYLLFLPLYQNLTKLELGFWQNARVLVPPATARRGDAPPIVFYGTSITQGGCASRTGMAHPAIVSRWLDHEVINLGFSGAGRMEPALANLIAELDASLYIIDCLPNLNDDETGQRIIPFVQILREKRPETPILIVEDARPIIRNQILRAQYDQLVEMGVTGLHYLPGEGLLAGVGEEGTVDGVHPTDLGFHRMAEAFTPAIRAILKK